MVLDLKDTLYLIVAIYLLWVGVWYAWHGGALRIREEELSFDVDVSSLLSPFITVITKNKVPPIFYYEGAGRVLLINRRYATKGGVLSSKLISLFIVGRVLQHLSDEWFVPLRRWLEVLAKLVFLLLPVFWFLWRGWGVAWGLFAIFIMVLIISYWDTDGYIRALVLCTENCEMSESEENMLYSVRFYPFSLFMILRLPLDIITYIRRK